MLFDLLAQLPGLIEAGSVVPDVEPEEPPGVDGFNTILNWISWGVIMLGLAGFMASAGYLAFASFTGREINGVKGLVICIIVCVLAVAAAAIVRVFV